MFTRVLLVWLMLLALAFVNGGLRELWLIPRMGLLVGHAVSSVTLSAGILTLSWLTIRWIHPGARSDALLAGIMWVTLTLAFEFLAGYFAFHKTWNELLADYNIMAGRIWVVVLLTALLAPLLPFAGRVHEDAW